MKLYIWRWPCASTATILALNSGGETATASGAMAGEVISMQVSTGSIGWSMQLQLHMRWLVMHLVCGCARRQTPTRLTPCRPAAPLRAEGPAAQVAGGRPGDVSMARWAAGSSQESCAGGLDAAAELAPLVLTASLPTMSV